MRLEKKLLSLAHYDLEDGFYVNIVPEGELLSFWMGHRDCDIQERMFALSRELAPEERWETLLESELPEYIEDFREGWLEE